MQKKIKNRKINCHIRTCSGYPEKWIPAINARMTEDCGRSMVEMLGVLAVMGVLSVGGVAMYTSAMNKYRANEILNEASKRVVMVAGQLLTNPSATTMSLAQFGSNAVAGATFGENATISNGKITLTFETAPDEAICNQMIAATGTNSAMLVAPGCGTITFNADMSKGGVESGSGGGIPERICTLTASDCASGALVEDECTCAPATNNQQCTDHTTNQCGLGYYCQFNPSDCGDSDRGTGICTAISGGSTKGGHWVGPQLDWWSANSWCIGKGSSGLITYATLSKTVTDGGYACNKTSRSCDWDALLADGLSGSYRTAEDHGDFCNTWNVHCNFKSFDGECLGDARNLNLEGSTLCE